MFQKHLIPNAQDLPEGKALTLKIEDYDFLVTRQKGEIVAYENRCPHQNKPLHWSEQEVVADEDYLKCHHHGALFSPLDGTCVTGPCQGSHLKKATVGIEQGNCYLLLA
ncbi:Rieske (2Fe-2S) protein [Marinomonas posidonica]|uniref:Rieske (2Fe-2S) iron-sulfur domain protein n=1 Tax=Marinomonas posidonica (strain CECT 7376 / NCIMB 14433 / IVIA-Po-181) TaxID=491952 RepID=F6CY65_MARPP|nr:Rieske (2Fe-2S) protein [Marinomonas posidonica]AEF55697.1 Rieske (2Fe-2S) iron-sulfur domain protein [Marinomonas posidonica IVIA-Po-181]